MNKDTLYDKYGFTQWATIMSGGKTYIQYIDNSGINLLVNWDTGEFTMKWNIPQSIFTIECPECSPIINEEHFKKMYLRFREVVCTYKSER